MTCVHSGVRHDLRMHEAVVVTEMLKVRAVCEIFFATFQQQLYKIVQWGRQKLKGVQETEVSDQEL